MERPEAGGARASASQDAPQRLFWPDFIRVIAVFSVIVLHVAAVPVTQFKSIDADVWWWAHGFDSLVRPCIPLFVMLSGALLLPAPDSDPRRFARRRISRVVVPFIVWSALYAGWNALFHGTAIGATEFARHLIQGFTAPVSPHLWYLPLVIGLYLLAPILRIYVLNASLANQLYFAMLWLIATVVFPAIQAAFKISVGYSLAPVFGYVGYFVLGATLFTYLPRRIGPPWLALLAVVASVGYGVTLWGTYVATVANNGQLDEHFYSYLSANVIAMSVALFILLRECAIRLESLLSARTRSAIARAGEASFGIYLVHMIFIDLLTSGAAGITLGPLSLHPAFGIPVTTSVVFLASLLTIVLLRKIPGSRWLVP